MRKKYIIITSLCFAIGLLIFTNFLFLKNQKVSAQSQYSESFEIGWGGWQPDYYLQCEHETPPCSPLEWSMERSTDQAYNGIYSLKGYINGIKDDGTIWAERQFSAQPDSDIKVDLGFYFWSAGQSDFNTWPIVAYAGVKNPEDELDFAVIGHTAEIAGWKNYLYSANFKTDSTGNFWIGFGFGVTWETPGTYYMDLITVNISPSESSDAISKSVSSTSAQSGDILTYYITYTNRTNHPVENILISDQLPTGATFVSADNGCRLMYNNGLYCSLWQGLSPGQSWQVSFQVRIQ